MRNRAVILSGALAGALLITGPAMADPVTVDGIQMTSDTVFEAGEFYTNVVSGVGDELMGYGRINSINGQRSYCADGSVMGCELTFAFSGYTPEEFNNHVTYSGGEMTFFADATADFNASVRSSAVDGKLFLSTVGHNYLDTESGRTGTLITTGSNLRSNQAQGSGVGYLDVTGGDAAGYFDTDSFDDFLGGTTDIQFNTTFTPNACDNTTDMQICGAAFVKSSPGSGGPGNPTPVPAPGALGLMGLALAGLGVGLRRRRHTG